MAQPALPRHLEQICHRAGRVWADTSHFHVVVNWLNATPAAPQPPLRYLLNLTVLLLGTRNVQEAPDRLQAFWYDSRNGYQMRVRGYYNPGDKEQTSCSPYFWQFLSGGLRQFCGRTAGEAKKKEQVWVHDGETGAARAEAVQAVSLQQEDADGQVIALELPDDDPSRQPEAALLRDALSEPLHNALARLTPRQREILEACLEEDVDRTHAAARLGMSMGTLNVTFLRIKRLLKDTLEKEAPDDGKKG